MDQGALTRAEQIVLQGGQHDVVGFSVHETFLQDGFLLHGKAGTEQVS
jgi:hypothetical protein